MDNALIRKLQLFGPLPDADRSLLDDVVQDPYTLKGRTSIIREGEAPNEVHLVLSGFACRYKVLRNGSRQIFAYLVPGDFCDLHVFILSEMDHGIETLSACDIVDIPRHRVLELTSRPAIARALWWATLVDEATLREWLVNLGQRSPARRIAHLFCEVHLRLRSVGLADENSCSLPITQAELGDTMGLSSVHVNRALQELRADRLIVFQSAKLTIPDLPKLRRFCGFNPNYLHLTGGKRDQDSGDVVLQTS